MSEVNGSLIKLRRMANQIGTAFAAMKHDEAVLATADHIHQFWDPRMKAQIFADDREELNPIAKDAINQLAAGQEPGSQTPATQFNAVNEVGHADAG